jgi:hypothetical protein
MFRHVNSNVPLMEQVFDMGGIMDVWSLMAYTPQSLNYDAVSMTNISSNPYYTWPPLHVAVVSAPTLLFRNEFGTSRRRTIHVQEVTYESVGVLCYWV